MYNYMQSVGTHVQLDAECRYTCTVSQCSMYHFMAVFGFERHTSVFGMTGFTMVTTQYPHVCACDTEEAWEGGREGGMEGEKK